MRHRLMNYLAGTFHNFRRLPAEMQNAIWEMALPDSRVLVPYHDDGGQMALIQYYKPPSLRGVCKESWAVTEKEGAFLFGNQDTLTYGIWFNYSKDVVAWLCEQFDSNWYLPSVENIAIEWHYFESRTDCIRTLSRVIDMTPDYQEVIVLTRPQPCDSHKDLQGRTVQLFSLNSDDVIWNSDSDIPDFWYQPPGDTHVTWTHMKKGLEVLYRDDATLQELYIERDKLPVLEAKEVLFSTKQAQY
ncbi:hypothetical protein CSOJ01_05916 [Colletotrichum sojae]|uniref:2EXR domain-containing protein n=1 Tax=Colletotrichum sojae TaxID=2175907 RepID=A0A8H6MWT9_9PEZI|nr:hypothetical protein CSOJ01_05916 [Colletotrichum sojae]